MPKLLMAVLVLLPGSALAQPAKCTWAQKVQCDPGKVCKALPLKTWGILDLTAKTYKRCDRLGCDSYSATVTQSGIYKVVDIAGRGFFVKVANDGTATEAASLGNSVLVSQGMCR